MARFKRGNSRVLKQALGSIPVFFFTFMENAWVGYLQAVTAWHFFDRWPKNPPAMESGSAGTVSETAALFFA